MNISGFLDHLRARNYSDATISSYALELRKFEHYLREQKLRVNQVQHRHIDAYLCSRDPEFQNRPASTRRRLAVLGSFYDYVTVMSNGHVRNPLEAMRYPRRQPPNPKPLSDEQVAVLMDGVDNEHLPGSGVVGVGRVKGKGNKEREFLIDLPTLRLIHAYLTERGQDGETALLLSNRDRRINKRTVQHLLSAWCERLGLPPLHPHQLRATFATRLNRVGVPTLEISSLLGHADISTTMAYVKPDARRIRTEFFAAMEQIN
jgi:site-specific recombinase XerD